MAWPSEAGAIARVEGRRWRRARRRRLPHIINPATFRAHILLATRGKFRVFNDAEYRIYWNNARPPQPGDPVNETTATLPYTPAGTFADGTWWFSMSAFNGIWDSGFLPLGPNGETYLRLDIVSGSVVTGPPNGPQSWTLEARAGGVIRVSGGYLQAGSLRADQFFVEYTIDGVDTTPDFSLASGSTAWGDVEKNVATYTRDTAGDLDMHSNPAITRRIFTEFDLSTMTGRQILTVGCKYDVATFAVGVPYAFREIGLQPTLQADDNAGNQAIYDAILAGALIATDTMGGGDAIGWRTTDLGSGGVASLQAAIDAAQAYHAIGAKFASESGAVFMSWVRASGLSLLITASEWLYGTRPVPHLGLAMLTYDLPAQPHGTEVRVRLRMRRNDGTTPSPDWVYSENPEIKTIVADAQGPSAPLGGDRFTAPLPGEE